MERGSGFFGQLFSRDSGKRPEQQNPSVDASGSKDQPAAPSRREFLKFLGKAAGVAVASELLGKEAFATEQETKSVDVKDEAYENERKERKQLSELMFAMSEFNDDYSKEHGYPDDRTLHEQDQLRAKFLTKFKDQLPLYLELTQKYGQSFAVGNLRDADCAGLYYRHLQTKGLLKNRPLTWKDGDFFAVRAEDFLPTGEELHPEEIDPRLGKLNDAKTVGILEKHQAWADPDQQKGFKKLLDDPAFRSLAQRTDCTLAEVYSIIKAAMKQQDLSGGSTKDHAVHLLLEREQMKKEVLIGPDTDQVIIYNYVPKTQEEAQFDKAHDLDDIALSCLKREGESLEQTKKRITRIESTDEVPVGIGKKDAAFLMEEAIRNSRGKTTIVFNNHGMPGAQYLGETQRMTAKSLALTLVERMISAKDPNIFKGTKLIFDSCFSYDFTRWLMAEIRGIYEALPLPNAAMDTNKEKTAQEQFHLSFNELQLPTVIAMAQEGSFGYDSSTKILARGKKAIAKEKKLTAGYLMRRIQPEYYPDADMTFFHGEKGKVVEVGQNDQADSKTRVS